MPETIWTIKQLTEPDNVEAILRALPEWFGIESAIVNYCADAKTMATYFAVLPDERRIAFMCLRFNNQFTAEIHVMGILKEFHGKGIGKTLVQHAKTLSQQHGCE